MQLIIIHNASFYINFLNKTLIAHDLQPFNNQVIDTLKISQTLFKGERKNSIEQLIQKFKIQPQSSPHRALSDAKILSKVY